jgi:hypothetical protein
MGGQSQLASLCGTTSEVLPPHFLQADAISCHISLFSGTPLASMKTEYMPEQAPLTDARLVELSREGSH